MSAAPEPSLAPRELCFTDEDQQRFAAHSRDVNPMHVSALAARRTLSGRQVVHGIHLLMQALERYEPRVPVRGLIADCSFAQPVSVGDPVTFAQMDAAEGRSVLRASVRGLVCMEVEIDPAAAGSGVQGSAAPPDLGAVEPGAVRSVDDLTAPLDDAPQAQAGSAFEMQPGSGDGLARVFPRAAALVGAPALTALAQTSFFVGMVCPGLHSVYSSLRFALEPAHRGGMRFRVRRWDPRFRLFTVDFAGPVAGELRAFQRPKPQPQPAAAEAAAVVAAREFEPMRALVIGGSRGLGETTAKLICGGGGQAWITYASGREDALRVAADVNGNGRGRCEALALDLSKPFTGLVGVDPGALNCVYYFATPHIYTKRQSVFSREAFDEFARFYLERFHELCLWLESAERERPALVYLPSTVFIDARPKGMTEYAMVKAAAEQLALDLNRNLSSVRIVQTRLPRLATDQTASILGQTTASNLEVMAGVVRQMSSAMSSL